MRRTRRLSAVVCVCAAARTGRLDGFKAGDIVVGDIDGDGRDELAIGTFGTKDPHTEAGYWILPGTQEGPSTKHRTFIATKNAGSS